MVSLSPETSLILSDKTSVADVEKEIRRLVFAMDSFIRRLPMAEFSTHLGTVLPGCDMRASIDLTISMRADNTHTAAGWYRYLGNRMHLNIGEYALWGDIVEVIAHEVCHRYRPAWESHSPAFWQLLGEAMMGAYQVHGPEVRPPKGRGQYYRDWVTAENIRRRFSWANIRPLKPENQQTFFRFTKEAA